MSSNQDTTKTDACPVSAKAVCHSDGRTTAIIE